jgi:hypothetical protein
MLLAAANSCEFLVGNILEDSLGQNAKKKIAQRFIAIIS